MTVDPSVDNIVFILKNAVASALSEQNDKLSIEIKELTHVGTFISVSATYKITPFLGGRTGRVSAIIAQKDSGYEITSLRIDE
jgi:hypothetical protein